jgi:hypothetical protein
MRIASAKAGACTHRSRIGKWEPGTGKRDRGSRRSPPSPLYDELDAGACRDIATVRHVSL